jgi:ribonuclease Z
VPRVQGASTSRTARGRRVLAVALAMAAAGCVEGRLRAEFLRPDTALLSSPAMHLVLCGTGTGIADPHRAGPCTAVIAGGRVFIVDLGPGGSKGADLTGVPLAALHAVLLTTFLNEDLADLGEGMTRSWIAGRSAPLLVYGPPGTRDVVGDVVALHRRDVAMRMAHHDAQVLHAELAGAEAREFAIAPDGATVVLDEDGLRITAFSVDVIGGVAVVGYRFDYRGRAIVIGGHAKPSATLAHWSAGADILVHEAAPPAMIARGIETMNELGRTRIANFSHEMLQSHASPIEIAQVARDAGVGQVVFSRLYPPPNSLVERWAFLRGVRAIFPNAILGEDGMRFRLDPR